MYDSGAAEPPKIVFNNEDVLMRGFGQRIELQDFDVIRNLRTKQMSLADGKYTLKQLQKLGLSKPGRSGDHVITTDLYLNQDRLGVSEELGAGNAAYVFGSIKFQLADNTIFDIKDGRLEGVEGRIQLKEDNFDHESANIPGIVSVLVHGALGDDQNFDHVKMLFEGPGKKLTYKNSEFESLAQPKNPRRLHFTPTMRRLMSGDLSALDPENRPFSPNLLRHADGRAGAPCEGRDTAS